MNGSDEGCYELSIGNPDKGVMPIEECRKRIKQFTDADIPLLVTKVNYSPRFFGNPCAFFGMSLLLNLDTGSQAE